MYGEFMARTQRCKLTLTADSAATATKPVHPGNRDACRKKCRVAAVGQALCRLLRMSDIRALIQEQNMTMHSMENPSEQRSCVTAVMTAMTDAERPWVQEAIRSILYQTVLPESVIVLVETANQWIDADLDAARYPDSLRSLIRIHRMPLARLGAVRNTGTRLATTDWVAYLDGDDLWKPERLAWQLEAARNAPEAQFIGGDFVFIDAKSRPFAFSNGSTPTPSSWMVRRDLMLRHPFDPELTMGEDFYWLRATRAECPRVRVPRVVTGYRIRGMSLSSVQYGYSRQRKIREAMARAAGWPFLRLPMLGATYVRYRINRRATYDL